MIEFRTRKRMDIALQGDQMRIVNRSRYPVSRRGHRVNLRWKATQGTTKEQNGRQQPKPLTIFPTRERR